MLGEYIKHHVKEEQNEILPKLKKTKLDLKALGQNLATARKRFWQKWKGKGAQACEGTQADERRAAAGE